MTMQLKEMIASALRKVSPSDTATHQAEAHNEPSSEREHETLTHPSWLGIEGAVGTLSPTGTTVYRHLKRREIVTGRVIKHVGAGVLVEVLGSSVGLVTHAELDWNSAMGKKYFPIGSEQKVMVMSRPGNPRLYLSIKEANFDAYFRKSVEKFPIGSSAIGFVKVVKEYGVFIELTPRIEVFIHRTDLAISENPQEGDEYNINISGYDFNHHRIICA